MIRPVVTFDARSTAEFQAALREYIASTKRDLQEIINQRALNVAERAFDIVPPATGVGVDVKRRQISKYLNEPLSQKLKYRAKDKQVFKITRRNIGTMGAQRDRKFVKTLKAGLHQSGAKWRQLQRRHLIVQARRRKEGKKGLYGKDMRYEAGMLSRGSTGGVGFVKSSFLPAIYALNKAARFKFPYRKTKNIKRWSGSGSWGSAQPAHAQMKSEARFSVNIRLTKRSAHTAPRVNAMLDGAVIQAMAEEATEMREHVRRKMQARANRHMVSGVKHV